LLAARRTRKEIARSPGVSSPIRYSRRGKIATAKINYLVSDPFYEVFKMAQPHKGPRVQVNAYLPGDVLKIVDREATDLGISRSQHLANQVCVRYGRADLVRQLDLAQEKQLKASVAARHDPNAPIREDQRVLALEEGQEIKVRVPSIVCKVIDRERPGVRSRREYVSSMICELYDLELEDATQENRKEPLELPTRREPAA
jgi:hypothetical protein